MKLQPADQPKRRQPHRRCTEPFRPNHLAMAARRQLNLSLEGYIRVDLFAGGGGASIAVETATGEPVSVAINHDAKAISMHTANHPHARHYQEDLRKVDPREATGGRIVGHLHASPECTHHSQAAGGQPRSVESRSLSWQMIRWTGQTAPIMLSMENVMQILQWGPLIAKRCPVTGRVMRRDKTVAAPGERVPVQEQYLVPDPKRRGLYWRRMIRILKDQGYELLYGKLNAADYGAPTTRERLFMIARRDGVPLRWPEPTHAKKPGKGQQPWVPVATCIDWSIPCPSIFMGKEEAKGWRVTRPLADKTMERIRKGVQRFVLDHPDPFIVSVNHSGYDQFRGQPISSPLQTVTASHGFAVVAPVLVGAGGPGYAGKPASADAPIGTLLTENHRGLAVAYLAQQNGGYNNTPGHHPTRPASSITTTGSQQQVVTANLVTLRNNCDGSDVRDTAPTVTAGGTHLAIAQCTLSPLEEAGALRVAAFLMGYYGSDNLYDPRDPAATITTRDRIALVTVQVHGHPYVIVDIGMRMLTPAELYRAQGFPPGYIIDRGHDGKPMNNKDQVRMCGNSVSPPPLIALLNANPLIGEWNLREAA